MAEQSVAPKERINITYKPATGDANEELELPMKLMVMGDFTLDDDDTPLEDRKAVSVNKDNFNDVLSAHNVGMTAAVPNKASDEEGAEMTVNLEFKSMKDFTPEAVVNQVPELKKLLELRNALQALKGPLGNERDFRKKIESLLGDPEARAALLGELGIDND
jgi:type VI secretion system protein ImpB